jgi:hypothetical protein
MVPHKFIEIHIKLLIIHHIPIEGYLTKKRPNITNESDKEPLVLMLIRYHLRAVKL